MIAIVLHMAAVLLIAIPSQAHDPLSTTLKERVLPIVAPYLALTMQWQRWDLFAPDPSTVHTTYDVSMKRDGEERWTPIITIDERTYPGPHHARMSKMLGQTWNEDQDSAVSQALIDRLCGEYGWSSDVRVRITPIDQDVTENGLGERKMRDPFERQCSAHSAQ